MTKRLIKLAAIDKISEVQAEIISKVIGDQTFEFGIHPELKGGVFQKGSFSISEVNTGRYMWKATQKKKLKVMLDEWVEKIPHDKIINLIQSQPKIEELPEIYEHEKTDALQRKEDWAELTKILGFTPKGDGLIMAMSGKFTLDIVALDRRVNCPDGISLRDHIKNTYGERAEELVSKLK
jgi:hypothetical protein